MENEKIIEALTLDFFRGLGEVLKKRTEENSADSVREFMKERKRLFSVSGIEKRAEIPKKTLEHFLSGRRGLKEEYLKRLVEVLKELGY